MTKEDIAEIDSEVLFADGFDDAILGLAERCGMDTVVAYDTDKVIEMLMSQGMDDTEAREYFDYNIVGAYVGEKTPIFIRKDW